MRRGRRRILPRCATEAVIKRNSTTKRTIYEIKLPKGALGIRR
jgi:hypothetical protein